MNSKRLVLAFFLLTFDSCLHAAAPTLPPTVELRQIGDLMVPFQAGLPIPTYEPQARPRTELVEGWRMLRLSLDPTLTLSARTPLVVQALEKEGRGAHAAEFDDSRWIGVVLPSVANPSVSPQGGAGMPASLKRPPPAVGPSGVWYRRRLGIPPAWQGRRVLLHCLAANYVADVWVNGRYVGYHEGGFTPFSFDITDWLAPGAANTIALRVDNPPWDGPGAAAWTGSILPGRGDWWNATGVLRDIFLEAVPAVSVVRADVRTEPAEEGTKVRAAVVLRNASAKPFAGQVEIGVYPSRVSDADVSQPAASAIALLGQRLEVRDGAAVFDVTIADGATVAWNQEFTVDRLAAWSPARPYLYVLEVVLRDEKRRLVDRLQMQFGARTIAVDGKQPRLLLNGAPVHLAGMGRVEDDPELGRAVSYQGVLRVLIDLRGAKWMGANFVRLGRGVNHPVTTILADRLGLACWEEIPAAWLDAEAMQEQWERRHVARQTLIEMIYQDFNRPSVCFWGVGYLLGPGAIHRDFVRDLADTGRFLDGTRLIGETAVLDDRSPTQTEGDVIGYALDPATGANQDALSDAVAILDRRHKGQSGKPVIITEFGARAGGDADAWDRQVAAAQDLTRIFAARSFIAGYAWWSLADYLTPEGPSATGLLTRDRRTTRPVGQILSDGFEVFQRGGEGQ